MRSLTRTNQRPNWAATTANETSAGYLAAVGDMRPGSSRASLPQVRQSVRPLRQERRSGPAEYRRFRALGQELVSVSEQICDRQLKQPPDTGVKKTALDGLLAAEILWDIQALLGRQSLEDLDLEALETAVRRQALRLAGRAVEQRLNADHSAAE